MPSTANNRLEIVNRHLEDIHRFAWLMSGDNNIAREILLDTVELIRRRPKKESFIDYESAWIMRQAYLAAVKRLTVVHGSLPLPSRLNEIPPTDRGCILLRDVFKFPYIDIAAIAGASPDTIAYRISRTRLQLTESQP